MLGTSHPSKHHHSRVGRALLPLLASQTCAGGEVTFNLPWGWQEHLAAWWRWCRADTVFSTLRPTL